MTSARHGVATWKHLLGTAVSATPTSRKICFIRCCTSTASLPLPPPSRLQGRRNNLRRKLLKTLKKPPPGTVTPAIQEVPAEESAASQGDKEVEFGTEAPVDEKPAEEFTNNPIVYSYNNIKSHEEVEASGPDSNESTTTSSVEAPILGFRTALTARDAVKYGVYIVGLCLAFRAVTLALGGGSDEEQKRVMRRSGEVTGRNEDNTNGHAVGGGKSGVINGQPLDLGDTVIEAKIAQIGVMAREARDTERKNSMDRESGVVGIEEEENEDDDNVDSSSSGRSKIEKKIVGRLSSVSKKLNNSTRATLWSKPWVASKNGGARDGLVDRKDEGNNHLHPKTVEVKNENGHVQRKRLVSLDDDSDAAKCFEPQSTLNKDDDDDDKHDAASYAKGRRSRIKQVGTAKSHRHPNNNEADDLGWWHDLPYLLVIVMMDGSEERGRRQGFYTLDNSSDAYTVLFEDQIDAKNFSHVVGSYFKELEDIRVSVMPLSTKVVMDVMDKSQDGNVLVVRKGQLKLYAGQPLAEVETVLRSLLK